MRSSLLKTSSDSNQLTINNKTKERTRHRYKQKTIDEYVGDAYHRLKTQNDSA